MISDVSVRAHMEFLASDAMNGRGSGTRDEWIAVTYVASHLRRLGLEPLGDDGGYVQKIDVERPELAGPPVLAIGGQKFTHGSGITVAAMNAATASGPLARYAKGRSVAKGSVVFVPEITPEMQAELTPATLVLSKSCGPSRGPAGARYRGGAGASPGLAFSSACASRGWRPSAGR